MTWTRSDSDIDTDLVGLLERRCDEGPKHPLYTFLTHGDEEGDVLTSGELMERARAVAKTLQDDLSPGDRVLLLQPPGLDFIVAFFGCLLAGMVAVPAYPPRPRRGRERLRGILVDAAPRAVLTTAALLPQLRARLADFPELAEASWLAVDAVDRAAAAAWKRPAGTPETLAFLQYTSGSTAMPKGVMVSHRNLLDNQEMIRRAFGQDAESVVVSWLPPYHDMGLIGGILQPLYVGGRCVLMAPAAFLQKPVRWLRAISRFSATTSGAPNFAYELCADLPPDDGADLDLRSWRVAFNGAEPVRADTMERFARRFAPRGFEARAFYPCYGLAEATLFVSGAARPGEPTVARLDSGALERGRAVDGDDRRLVSCGRSWGDHEIVIVEPNSATPCAADDVGEIWLRGASVAGGYWGRPDATEDTFGARLDGREGRWLRTGDLGFLRDGDLFVTGRLKDLIILGGRNHYPQDLELTARRSHPELLGDAGAVFTVPVEGRERVVVLQEIHRRAASADAAMDACRRDLAAEHGVGVYEVVLLRQGSILRTSSGKVRRQACRAAYLDDALQVVARSRLSTADLAVAEDADAWELDREALPALDEPEAAALVDGHLRRLVRRWVALEPGDGEVSLESLGLDSLQVMELQGRIESDFGVAIGLDEMLGANGPADLARQVVRRLERASSADPAVADRSADELLASIDPVGEHPMSANQRALWFLERLTPGGSAHHVDFAARVRSPLSLEALGRALEGLGRRHAALRTVFVEVDGEPRQRVLAELAAEIVHVQASAEEAQDRLASELARPFDLENGPLLRVVVASVAADRHELLLAAHHGIMDFWSFVVLLSELGPLYEAAVEGRAASLPAVSAQWPELVRRQERWLAGPRGDLLRAYWHDRMDAGGRGGEAPADRPRTPGSRRRPAGLHEARFGDGLAEAIEQRARALGLTPYMLLLGGFGALFHRLSGRRDLCFGSPMACRGGGAAESAVGYLTNPVPLFLRLDARASIGDYLRSVRQTTLGALAHQDYPSHLLTERARTASRDQRELFSTLFVLNKPHLLGERGLGDLVAGLPGAEAEVGGLRLAPLHVAPTETPSELYLTLMLSGGVLAVHLLYDAELFDATTTTRWTAALGRVYEALAAGFDGAPEELPLLARAQRHQILVEWNPPPELAELRPVHRAVAEQAARRPDAIALVADEAHLSYGELDRRVGVLAAALGGVGVGGERRVGLCLERSAELITAMLAVLRAGGAYVPMDPADPETRRRGIEGDAGVDLVIDAGAFGELVARGGADDAAPSEDPPMSQLAYLLYTSGSTGRPKGVMVRHGGLAGYIAGAVERFALGPGDRVLQFASPGFDTSAEEIYGALTGGATLVLRTARVPLDREAFLDACGDARTTVLDLPTAYWHDLVEGSLNMPSALRLVILGGEKALPDKLERWRRRVGDTVRLINTYGPTEGTIVATAWDLVAAQDPIPIGRPVARARTYVVSPELRPTAPGAAGQLCLAGGGLARGYFKRPSRTALSFVPDPFAPTPGERLYLTGDRARFRADGVLEFLGRVDAQVKIRGFRIEPGEVAATLSGHEQVRDAVVTAFASTSGELRLAAYVVPRGDSAPEPGELARFLRGRLPLFMVPAVFCAVPELPRLPSGKVDARALPDPATLDLSPVSTGKTTAPRSPLEETLVELCTAVLGAEPGRIGVFDNLFDHGCHSLLAARIVARIRDDLGVELPLVRFFEQPTVADLARAVTEDRQEDTLPPLGPMPREGLIPLSFSQERLWFLRQLDPSSVSYNVPRALRMRGPLNPALVEQVMTEVVRRHEILRTAFPEVDGRPVQVIHPPGRVDIPLVDLEALGAERAWSELMRRIVFEARADFDFERGPLLRQRLFRLGPDDHMLVQTEHHLVHDGWTQTVLVREFLAIYRAFVRGEPSPLPELTVQYADFALWQRRWLRDEILAQQLDYWRGALAGAPPLLDVPLDRPRRAVMRHEGQEIHRQIEESLADALRELGRRHSSTLYMVLMSIFNLLLHRFSGSRDLVVGTGMANRRAREVESLIGMVINSLALRTRIEPSEDFDHLLKTVRDQCLAAYANQDLPLESLVGALNPERSLSYSPIFQLMFSFMDAPMPALTLPGLELSHLDVHNRSAKLDMNVVIIPLREQEVGGGEIQADGTVRVLWEYNLDIYDGTTIERLWRHFRQLARAVTEDSSRPLEQCSSWSAAERHQVLFEWNDTRAPLDASELLHGAIFRQAERTPDAVALVGEGRVLSYAETARRAERLAAWLGGRGVGADVPVAVRMERSPERVVALLGILAAGGAYVPIDPEYPAERQELMLSDSGAPVVLDQAEPWGDDPPIPGATRPGATRPGATRPPVVFPEHAAYIIYTSGSTGRPKGVVCHHGGIVNRLDWMQETYGLAADDRVLQKTPISFDVSVWELFWPLRVGATLVVAPPASHKDSAELADLLGRERITTVHFVPSMLAAVLGEPALDAWSSRRRILASGEALGRELAERCGERLGPILHNLYGPTEAAVDVTYQPCEAMAGSHLPTIPIGRPVANTAIHVLDRRARPVPLGGQGELHIAGVQPARGYLGRPGLTAERFVPNGFAGRPGERLYRTGDLVRYRPDGRLEFLSRIDHQIKLRGLRIELEEIQAVLDEHPAVERAVVGVRTVGGDSRLVAWVLPSGDHRPLEAGELEAALGRRLPAYMIPGTFVELETLPLTPSGKIDRRALPEPAWGGAGSRYQPPRSAEEERLAGIWSEVLGVERVGVGDHFFRLGGHSLLASQVLARTRQAFGLDIPLRSLFETPELGQFASAWLSSARSVDAAPLVPSQAPDDGTLSGPLSFGQERLWFLYRLDPTSTAYNMPSALHLRGPLAVDVLRRVLQEVVDRHAGLRTRIVARDGELLQQVGAPGRQAPWREIDLGVQPGEAARLASGAVLRRELAKPFDLSRDPLLRALLIRLGRDEHILLLSVHHIVSDGWSVGVLTREIAALYEAFAAGLPSPLPPLPLRYLDYAAWQRRQFGDARLETHLAWWRDELRGAPPLLELPTDRPRPKHGGERGGERRALLDPSLAQRLGAHAREVDSSLFMVLTTAFFALLRRISGQDDLVVGTPVAGRERVETEGLVGLFLNLLALRARTDAAASFAALHHRVREVVLAAHGHQDMPFERLVQALVTRRETAHSPIFQVLFVMREAPIQNLRMRDLEVRPMPLEHRAAQYDLTVAAYRLDEGLEIHWEYAADLFDPATVDRWSEHYEQLLREAIEHPARPLAELSLLSPTAREQLLREGRGPARSPSEETVMPGEETVLTAFLAQARRAPQASAVTFEDAWLSYGELERRSARLARRLRDLGVGHGRRVGILLPRSPDAVVAILATLRVGAAYVPMDPFHPPARTAWVLEDAFSDEAETVVVTRAELLPKLAASEVRAVPLDTFWTDGAAPDVEHPADASLDRVRAGELAYVIYTSGSTGQPKGVQISHDALHGFIRAMADRFPLGPGDCSAGVAALTFDISGLDLYLPLSSGSRMLLVAPDVGADGRRLGTALVEQRARLLQATPVTWELLLDKAPDDLQPLVALCGGEALLPDLARRLLAVQDQVWNLYGPTETTIWSTAQRLDPELDGVPIGSPIDNTDVLILDPGLRLALPGSRGELCIGGRGLAWGYHGRPGLTAERFVPHPHPERGGERLYRTGDVARRRSDGALEILGRMDRQIKLRGFRIEPGEIENLLLAQPGVRQVVVTVHEHAVGDRRLVAYVVPEQGRDEKSLLEELIGCAHRHLPAHMVPSHILPLDAMPLTSSGKVDQRALPAPEALRLPGRDYQAPRSAMERDLTAIWQQALGVEQVGIDDNFFDIGGHSLLLLKVHDVLRERIAADLPLLKLFENPTIRTLAEMLQSARQGTREEDPDRHEQQRAGRDRLRRKLAKRRR